MLAQSEHRKIVHALTQWDTKQSARKNSHHNPYFLGIAFGSLASAEDEESDVRAVIVRALTGRCADFVLKSLDLPLQTDAELRR